VGAVLLALAVVVPGLVLRFSGAEVAPELAALLLGLAVVGAAFLASWAAEIIQLDISSGLAVALLALVAVLPELAVDFVFTWKAGTDPTQTPNILANMTGGNQLLLGVGWPLVVLMTMARMRGTHRRPPRAVTLEPLQSIDVAFLAVAAAYGLTLFLHRSLTLIDTTLLVGLYVAYLSRLLRSPTSDPDLVGPAAAVAELGTRPRRALNAAFFIVAAGTILAVAEPFAESLVAMGRSYQVPEFFLVKWLAPLASEAPELLVAGLFAWKLEAATGLGVLISAKVNQWALLAGSLPLVHAISSGQPGGIPLVGTQRRELAVTAAQCLLGVAIIGVGRIRLGEAWLILALFVTQLADSLYAALWSPDGSSLIGRGGVALAMLAVAAVVLIRTGPSLVRMMINGLWRPVSELAGKT
jgi:cation:H+ antiporter